MFFPTSPAQNSDSSILYISYSPFFCVSALTLSFWLGFFGGDHRLNLFSLLSAQTVWKHCQPSPLFPPSPSQKVFSELCDGKQVFILPIPHVSPQNEQPLPPLSRETVWTFDSEALFLRSKRNQQSAPPVFPFPSAVSEDRALKWLVPFPSKEIVLLGQLEYPYRLYSTSPLSLEVGRALFAPSLHPPSESASSFRDSFGNPPVGTISKFIILRIHSTRCAGLPSEISGTRFPSLFSHRLLSFSYQHPGLF